LYRTKFASGIVVSMNLLSNSAEVTIDRDADEEGDGDGSSDRIQVKASDLQPDLSEFFPSSAQRSAERMRQAAGASRYGRQRQALVLDGAGEGGGAGPGAPRAASTSRGPGGKRRAAGADGGGPLAPDRVRARGPGAGRPARLKATCDPSTALEEGGTAGDPAGDGEEGSSAAATLPADAIPGLSCGDGFGGPEGQADDERLADRANSLDDLPSPPVLMYQLLCSLAAACVSCGVSSLALSGQALYARAALFDPYFQPVVQLVEAMIARPSQPLIPSAVGASIVGHLRTARASVVEELDGPGVSAAATPADPAPDTGRLPAQSGLLACLMREVSRAADREAAAAAAAASAARSPGNLQMKTWETYIAKVDHRPTSFGCAVEWYGGAIRLRLQAWQFGCPAPCSSFTSRVRHCVVCCCCCCC
jgi:hypothetical protein